MILLDGKSYKVKHRVPLIKIPNIVLSGETDNIMLVRIPLELKKDKGDLILDVPKVIECSMWIAYAAKNKNIIDVTNSAEWGILKIVLLQLI